MSRIVVNGLMTDYYSIGKGPTVLLLHGWGDSKATFQAIVSRLKDDYRMVALDLPGFGATSPPDKDWGLSDYAKFVARFCDKLQLKPMVVIGHSNGGAIALRAVSTGELSPDRLVLLASAGLRAEHKTRRKALRLLAKAVKLPVLLLPASWQRNLKKRAYALIGSDLFVVENLQGTFKRIMTDDVREDAEKIDIPSLLLYGSNDSVTPPADGEILSDRLHEGKLVVSPGAGHFLHHEKPEEVNRLIEEFLR